MEVYVMFIRSNTRHRGIADDRSYLAIAGGK
jgi:hypothetical protein